jgi:DNA-binding NtrC family response regulator
MLKLERQPFVYVVDDEEVIASTLAMILHMQGGFRTRSFSKPLEAFEAARLEAPDLLISDVVMPLLSGIELAIRVREHCPNCKVLLFSGQAATAHLLEAARASGYDFEVLMKPVHPADLLARIRNLTEPMLSLQSTGALWTQSYRKTSDDGVGPFTQSQKENHESAPVPS